MPSPVALASFLLIAQAAPSSKPAPSVRLETQVAACPSPGEVDSALRQALGSSPSSPHGWVLSYGRDLAADVVGGDASLWMVLVDPSGRRRIERRIPASDEECSAIAGVMAAIVEREVRALSDTSVGPLPIASTRRPSRPTSLPPRLVLGAGPSLGTAQRLGMNLLLEARMRIAGPFCVRLGGALFSGSASQSVDPGTARVTSRYFTLAPLAAFPSTKGELAVGPSLLFSFDQGSGDLAQAGSGYRATLAIGLALAAAVRLSARWRLGVGLEGYHAAAGADFYVALDGKRTVVLAPPTWEGIGAVRLEFLSWP